MNLKGLQASMAPLFSAPRSRFFTPSLSYQLLTSPITLLARILQTVILFLRGSPPPKRPPIRIVCVSDTHTQTRSVPPGDLLIHCGDLGDKGSVQELQAQISWLNSLPHPRKVVVAGNHDTYLDPKSRETLSAADKEGSLDWGGIYYLQHRQITLSFPKKAARTLKIYGAPQIPACGGREFAFQYERGLDAWSETVPGDTDVLVTHTPPKWALDLPIGMGCEWLNGECWRVRPRLHVFGHVHEGRGRCSIWWDAGQRAYERVRERDGGLIVGPISPRNWIDVGLMMLFGFRAFLWSRLWGGESEGGLRVNAALMNHATGKIDNEVQVVEI